MAKILLQTTIPQVDDDWHVGRFSLLADVLRGAGHDVTARNRVAGDDPVLSTLETSDFDEVWIMAVDTGDGLTQADIDGIQRFRERGGGILTARDHQDLGACLCGLGSLGIVNHFHSRNPEADTSRLADDDPDNPNIHFPNYHSGANGSYQRIHIEAPAHELLRSDRAPGGVIEWFPAHPHEGAVAPPPQASYARAIATGTSRATGRDFNLAVTIDSERDARGNCLGRAIAESTFHHFADMNWDSRIAPPSFVKDQPSDEIRQDPERLEIFKDYVRNAARWLASSN